MDFGKKKSRRKEKAYGGFHKTLFWAIWHSNAFSHIKRLLQLGVAFNLFRAAHAATENMAFERGLAVAVDPACQAAFGASVNKLAVFGSCGQQIDLAETVVLGIHRVHSVDEGLHLAAHLVVVDGRGPADHIGVQDALHNGRHIVLDDAGTRLLARQAADAKLDFLASQRDEFHLMPGGFCALGKLLRQSLAVRAGAEAS